MASSYGPNFGFRRSDESMSIREGRLRVPVANTGYLQGLPVTSNYTTGEVVLATADAKLGPGQGGFLIQEEEHIQAELYHTFFNYDDTTASRTVGGRLAIVWSGSGVKVWMKNTAGGTQMFTETALAIGSKLGVASGGGKWGRYVTGTTDVTNPFLIVTAYSANTAGNAYLEAVVL